MKRQSMIFCLLMLCPLFIVGYTLAEDHKSTNLEKGKERKISSQQVKDARIKHKENSHKTRNRSKRHQPQELYQIELERQLQQRQMDFELQLDQREQEMHMERERREAEHRLRMETMQRQHDREMAERNFHEVGQKFLQVDFGLGLNMEKLHEVLTKDDREKVELLHLRLEQEKIKKMSDIRIQEIEIQISLRQAFFDSKPIDQKMLADQVNAIAKSPGELQFLELKTMLEIRSLLSEEQIQQLRYREENHVEENHDQ